MERTAYEIHDEPDALQRRLFRTGQEGEQAMAAAAIPQAGIRRSGGGTSRMEAALAAVREEASRMRGLLRFGVTVPAPAGLAAVPVARQPSDAPTPAPASGGRLPELLTELQATAAALHEANATLNATLQQARDALEMRVEKRTAELRRALEDREAMLRGKDLLIREIDHRVRNSLQLVSSMIRLQADRHADPMVREELRVAGGRVEAVAQVHSTLHAAGGTERVRFDEYLQVICSALRTSFTADGSRRTLELEADPVELPAGMAEPLGLMVNELVTNAFRHAFAADGPGTVWVELGRDADGRLRLSVADDGAGLPKGVDADGGLGLRLVTMTAAQLGATLDVGRDGGTQLTLTLPASSGGAVIIERGADGSREREGRPEGEEVRHRAEAELRVEEERDRPRRRE